MDEELTADVSELALRQLSFSELVSKIHCQHTAIIRLRDARRKLWEKCAVLEETIRDIQELKK